MNAYLGFAPVADEPLRLEESATFCTLTSTPYLLENRVGASMKKSRRKTVALSEALHQRLNTYALTATTAGVGVLALARASEAKIVYTPADVRIGANGS